MLVVGAVALVVIGPKDLPKALRSIGEAVGKVKRMASEFQGQFNDAMREAELHDLKKQVEDIGGSVQSATKVDFNPIQSIREELKGSASTSTAAAAATATAPMVLGTDVASASPEPVVQLPEPPPPFDPASLQGPTPEAGPQPVSEAAAKAADTSQPSRPPGANGSAA